MKATSKYEQLSEHIKKKINRTLQSVHPNTYAGRLYGEKVFLTSIPKAGTNLILQLLENLPGYRIHTGRGLRPWMFDSEDALLHKISKVKKGQIMRGHVPYVEGINQIMKESNIRGIFIFRDPRDVLFSHMKYVTNIDKTHRTHTFFKELENDTARIHALLNGKPGIVDSIPSVYSRYSGWRTCSNTISIRFEDLVGEKGGGSRTDQLKTVKIITDHLNLIVSPYEIECLAEKVFNTDSATFRAGKMSQWKRNYTSEQVDLLRKELEAIVIEYGYEKDSNW